MADAKVKSFWERPEGTTGMLVMALMLVGGAYGALVLLPVLLSMLTSLFAVGVAGIGVIALFTLITSRQFWHLGSYAFRSSMRALTSWFITIDPIGLEKNYVEDLEKEKVNLDANISNLRGQIEMLNNEMEKNKHDIEHATLLASRAKESSMQSRLQVRQAGRLSESNLQFTKLYKQIQFLYTFLLKVQENCDFLILDMKAEIKEQERQLKVINSGVSAIRSAQKILKGDPTKRQEFEQAIEAVAENYFAKVGEVKQFIEVSSNMIATMDLEQGVYDEEAMKRIEDLKNQDFLMIDDIQKKELVEVSAASGSGVTGAFKLLTKPN